MAYHIRFLILVLALSALYQAEGSVFHKKSCPKNVKPMQNFDVKKMAGAWYTFMASPGVLFHGEKCFKTTFINIESDRLQYIFDAENLDGTAIPSVTVNRTMDPARPGFMSHKKELEVKNFFGQKKMKLLDVESVILYTDYTNVELRYSCTELDNLWESDISQYFYITVRNRSFDSFKQIVPLVGMIREFGFDMNEVEFPSQQNCKV